MKAEVAFDRQEIGRVLAKAAFAKLGITENGQNCNITLHLETQGDNDVMSATVKIEFLDKKSPQELGSSTAGKVL